MPLATQSGDRPMLTIESCTRVYCPPAEMPIAGWDGAKMLRYEAESSGGVSSVPEKGNGRRTDAAGEPVKAERPAVAAANQDSFEVSNFFG